jgi:hypothetical protein
MLVVLMAMLVVLVAMSSVVLVLRTRRGRRLCCIARCIVARSDQAGRFLKATPTAYR